jgi:hypothetical protein
MNFYTLIKRIGIIMCCVITASCSNGPIKRHIKFINNTQSGFKCFGYTHHLLGTTFSITLSGKQSKLGSIGEAGISNTSSWACKPLKDGFTNYSLKTEKDEANPNMLTVTIKPVRHTVT